MDAVEVTARFDQEGEITPLRLTRAGRELVVESVGRRWRDESGYHALVMLLGRRVFELTFSYAEGRWYLESKGASPPVA